MAGINSGSGVGVCTLRFLNRSAGFADFGRFGGSIATDVVVAGALRPASKLISSQLKFVQSKQKPENKWCCGKKTIDVLTTGGVREVGG